MSDWLWGVTFLHSALVTSNTGRGFLEIIQVNVTEEEKASEAGWLPNVPATREVCFRSASP